MPLPKELREDLDAIERTLNECLLYPTKAKLGEQGYHDAHKHIQEAIYKIKKVRRTVGKSDIGDYTWDKHRAARTTDGS